MQYSPADDRLSKMVAMFVSSFVSITINDYVNENILIISRVFFLKKSTGNVLFKNYKLKFLFVEKTKKLIFQTKFLRIAI